MNDQPRRIQPLPGQESVWDYPRPPRLDPTSKHVTIEFNGEIIADTTRAIRVLETSHPPVYYIPADDVNMARLISTPKRTTCEFKGAARYWTVRVGGREVVNAAWSYPMPQQSFAAIRDYVAFYPGKMDACYVDGERVQPQEGDFYGGWITSNLVGPFKGGAETWGW